MGESYKLIQYLWGFEVLFFKKNSKYLFKIKVVRIPESRHICFINSLIMLIISVILSSVRNLHKKQKSCPNS